ncbi:MAG TPA: BON domain-containing protein [Candidatus Acidoferrales bacterium]|nr:BON domain-containing protein [Candidatus Acidoferrales bacterium]
MLILTLLLNLALLAPGPVRTTANQKGAPDKSSPRYEAWLKQEVRHQLLLLPWYTVFDQLAYSVNGYTVTLTGAVVNPTLKSDAENAVKHIEGVEKVVNQIHVLPNGSMDNQIRRAEYRKIYSQPQLFRYGVGNLQSIHIIVENGHVTLTGYVDSDTDKNVAGMMAKSVPNVFSVKNDLAVQNPK